MGPFQPTVRTTKAPIFVGTRNARRLKMQAVFSARWFPSQPSHMRSLPSAPVPLCLRNRSGARLRSLVLAVATSLAAAPAAPLSLGTPDVASFLGQPLQLRVPVVLDDPTDGGAQCVRVISQPGGDVPTLSVARIEVERGIAGAFLRVSTPQPVDEPVLRVVLEIGCTQRVRREFTLLLDPPIVTAGANVGGQSTPEIEFGM